MRCGRTYILNKIVNRFINNKSNPLFKRNTYVLKAYNADLNLIIEYSIFKYDLHYLLNI